ncbi:MAG: TonB-dependent receptor [Parvularcula sp.]|jgi:iron complex outermembrane receptor protein|nr:TonB-dependent receptor [Parvularcula sp.]
MNTKMDFRRRNVALLVAGASLLAWVSPATAQDSEQGEAQNPVIVVTAERRSEDLQTTPITVSAFDADALETANITDTLDLQFAVPGLLITNDSQDQQIFIRGVGTDVLGLGSDNSVATYVNGLYQSQQSQALQEFNDIDSVLVLKGPQGSLYGRNATGGAIIVNTREPSEVFEVSADALYSSFETFRGQAMINVPFDEGEHAARINVLYGEREGFVRNTLLNEDLWGYEKFGLNGSLRLGDGSPFKVVFRGTYFENDSTEGSFKADPVLDGGGSCAAPGACPADPFTVAQNEPTSFPTRSFTFSASASLDLGFAELNSTSGLTDFELGPVFADFDGTPTSLINDAGTLLESDTFQQEFTLVSPTGGTVEWLVGVNYFREDANRQFERFFLPGVLDIRLAAANEDLTTDAIALFGDATIRLSDRLSVTGGLRYSWEEKSLRTNTASAREEWDAVTGRGVLEYRATDDIFVFASVSRGFKSGAFNSGNPNDTVDPEYVWAYETGIKTTLANGNVRANISAFYYDYTDIQTAEFDNTGPTIVQQIGNASDATIYGIDADLQANLTDFLKIGANLSYLETEYDTYSVDDPFDGANVLVDVSGNDLTRAPTWSGSVNAEVTVPVGDGNIQAYADFYFQDDYNDFVIPSAASTVDGFELFNARLTYNAPQDRFFVAVFADNLFDREYITQTNQAGVGGLPLRIDRYGPPRSLGVQVGFEY